MSDHGNIATNAEAPDPRSDEERPLVIGSAAQVSLDSELILRLSTFVASRHRQVAVNPRVVQPCHHERFELLSFVALFLTVLCRRILPTLSGPVTDQSGV